MSITDLIHEEMLQRGIVKYTLGRNNVRIDSTSGEKQLAGDNRYHFLTGFTYNDLDGSVLVDIVSNGGAYKLDAYSANMDHAQVTPVFGGQVRIIPNTMVAGEVYLLNFITATPV